MEERIGQVPACRIGAVVAGGGSRQVSGNNFYARYQVVHRCEVSFNVSLGAFLYLSRSASGVYDLDTGNEGIGAEEDNVFTQNRLVMRGALAAQQPGTWMVR